MEEVIEEPPPRYIEAFLEKIEPIYRFDCTPENPEGNLFYIENSLNHMVDSFTWNPVKKKVANDLEYLTDHTFFHKYVNNSDNEIRTFKPTLYEVIKNLSEDTLNKTSAVEVILEREDITRVNGHYRGRAKLYKRIESNE